MSYPSLNEVSSSISLISTAKQIFSSKEMSSVSLSGNEEVKSRLKFIGKIPKGVKISTKPLSLQAESMTAKLWRTWYCENRNDTQSFLSETLQRSFDILDQYLVKNAESKIVYDMIRDLNDSIEGISNLKTTYMTDLKFVCNLDVLIESIQNKIQEVYTRHPKLKRPSDEFVKHPEGLKRPSEEPLEDLRLYTPSTSPETD